jgi:hypothetical protein
MMGDSTDIHKAVDKVLDFAGFFLSLGDMKQTDLLIAIANRDPEFTYYFETVTEPIETALDFFRYMPTGQSDGYIINMRISGKK